jgi:hypothetical protein
METVVLKAEDFKTVHNTLCELREVEMRLNEVISENLAAQLHRVIKGFEAGLKDAYAQDNAQFDSKMDYYSEFQRDNGLAAIWSVYELPVHGFLFDHPFPSDAFVVYKDQHCAIYGQTWADVYRAADHCIRNSGDLHHIFIENFELWGKEVRLTTGS